MVKHSGSLRRIAVLVAMATALPSLAGARLVAGDLAAKRQVREVDWLRLQLRVLAAELSYPAYRVRLEVGDDGAVSFEFLASSGLAEHIGGTAPKAEAEKLLRYHAEGIGEQLQQLLGREFPALAPQFTAAQDLSGRFLVPGKNWSDAPRVVATWAGGTLTWK